MLIEEIDGVPSATHPLARFLVEAGFVAGAMGLQATLRRDDAPAGMRHGLGDRYPALGGRPRPGAGRSSRSAISSPFASRYFESDAPPTDEDV
jgi:hypothetical protein